MPAEVQHTESDHRGAFFLERDGRRLAEMTYTRDGDDRITVRHTEVDPSLRGQGVARRLLDAVVAWARATGTRVAATCTYARGQFERDASLHDVYAS